MSLLVNSFNPQAAEGLMCRDTVSVGWDGSLFDCDFNQQLELSVSGNDEKDHKDPAAIQIRHLKKSKQCSTHSLLHLELLSLILVEAKPFLFNLYSQALKYLFIIMFAIPQSQMASLQTKQQYSTRIMHRQILLSPQQRPFDALEQTTMLCNNENHNLQLVVKFAQHLFDQFK